MKLACSECGTNLELVEVDKATFADYDSFNYMCKNPSCYNKEKHGDLISKYCTDFILDKMEHSGKINIDKIKFITKGNETKR